MERFELKTNCHNVSTQTTQINCRPATLRRQLAISSAFKTIDNFSDNNAFDYLKSAKEILQNSEPSDINFNSMSNQELDCLEIMPKSISISDNSYDNYNNNKLTTIIERQDQNNTIFQKKKLRKYFKIIFIGDSSVGKTSFINRAVDGTFTQQFGPTIGIDFKIKTMMIDEKLYELHLWDTAGQERYRSITSNYYRKVDGICLMYDVNNELSFLNVHNWLGSIQDTGLGTDACPSIPILILGNKIDARKSNHSEGLNHNKNENKFAIQTTRMKGCQFIETSAKTGYNVKQTLQQICRLMVEANSRRCLKQPDSSLRIISDIEAKSNWKKPKSCCRS